MSAEFLSELPGYLGVTLLGVLLGACELIPRYKDAPFRVLRLPVAQSYLALNGAVALVAYVLANQFGWTVHLSGSGADGPSSTLATVLASGLGAMMLLRSAVIKIPGSDNEQSVGLAALVEILLRALDRQIDRENAVRRGAVVQTLRARIPWTLPEFVFVEFGRALVSRCLSLMQTVTDEEQEQLADLLTLLDGDPQLDEAARIDGLLWGLLDLAGGDLLETAVRMTVEPDAGESAA